MPNDTQCRPGCGRREFLTVTGAGVIGALAGAMFPRRPLAGPDEQYIEAIRLAAERDRSPEVASFDLTPDAGKAEVSIDGGEVARLTAIPMLT